LTGDLNTTLLGEYIWLAYDTRYGEGNQFVVAASYYVSDSMRSINLYRIIFGKTLYLWQKDVLLVSINDIPSVTFENGAIMYLDSNT
jgi:hypothetical protein